MAGYRPHTEYKQIHIHTHSVHFVNNSQLLWHSNLHKTLTFMETWKQWHG